MKALIFDFDGTLADTESVHMAAFNHAFAEMGMDWVWTNDMYTQLLEVSGGKERILHYWKQVNPGIKELDAHALQDRIDRRALLGDRFRPGDIVRPHQRPRVGRRRDEGLRRIRSDVTPSYPGIDISPAEKPADPAAAEDVLAVFRAVSIHFQSWHSKCPTR